MFKFGRPYVFYDDNIVHDYISGIAQNWVGTTGATFFMSVDPAVPFHPNPGIAERVTRYARKIVSNDIYGTFQHNTDPYIDPFKQEMENLKTYWSDGSITKIGSGARAIDEPKSLGGTIGDVIRWDDEL